MVIKRILRIKFNLKLRYLIENHLSKEEEDLKDEPLTQNQLHLRGHKLQLEQRSIKYSSLSIQTLF